MDRIRAQAVERLLGKHRNLFPFSVKTRRGIGTPVAMLAALSGGGAYPARAEPLWPNSRRAKPPQIHSPNSSLMLRFGVPIFWINAVMMQESGGDVRARLTGGRWASCRSCLMPRPVRGPAMAWASILLTRATTFLLASRTCGRPLQAVWVSGSLQYRPKRYEEYLATGRALPTETQLYVTIPAPMIGGTPVEGTLTIARRAIPWQEAAPFVARGSRGSLAGSFSPFPPIDRASGCRSLAGELAQQPRAAGLFVEQAQGGRNIATRRQQCLFCQCDENASETRASAESIHGLRPVIDVHRVVQGKANRPVRLLLAS